MAADLPPEEKMTDPPIKVHRMLAFAPASEELMADYGQLREAVARALDPNAPQPPPPVDPGPNPDYLRLLAAAEEMGAPGGEVQLLRLLLELHAPKWNEGYSTTYHCLGDDSNGYDAEPPYWPCRTVAAIAEHLEVELGATP